MLAAVVLASILAQAEQAPAPPPPVPPAPPEPPPPSLANSFALMAQYAYRFRTGGANVEPTSGFSLGGGFEHRILTLPSGPEVGVAVQFFYDRFATGVGGAATVPGAVDSTRELSETSFALSGTAAWPAGWFRPYLALGAGVTVGYFSSPEAELAPGSATAVQPLARLAGGFDFALSPTVAIVVQTDYTLTFTRPKFTTDALTTYSLFGDLFHLGAGFLARF